MGRFFIASGNKLYFSGGPDITNGVPEECFPPANVFTLPDKVTCLKSLSIGLAVWTTADSYIVIGEDTVSFTLRPWQKNFGVPSQNAVAQDGDLLYIYTSQGQLFEIGQTPEEIGFAAAKLFASFVVRSVPLNGAFFASEFPEVTVLKL